MDCQHFLRNNKEPAKGVLVIITDRGRQKHSSLKYVPGKCNYCYSSNNLLKRPKTGQPAFQTWYKQDKRTIYVDHNWCCWDFSPTCLSMMWFLLAQNKKNKNKKPQLFSEKYSVMRATNDFLNTQTLVWHTDKKTSDYLALWVSTNMLHVTRTLPILSYKTQQDEREHLLYLPSHSPHSYDREKQEAQLSCSMPGDATVFFNTYRINLEHKDHTLKWQFTRIPLYADCTFPTFQGIWLIL